MWKLLRTAILATPLPAFPAWLTYVTTPEVHIPMAGFDVPVARILLTAMCFAPPFWGMLKLIQRLDENETSKALAGRATQKESELEEENKELRRLSVGISSFRTEMLRTGKLEMAGLLSFHIANPQISSQKRNLL